MPQHPIVHFELMGPDAAVLAGFYRTMFGWNTEAAPGFDDYLMIPEDDAGVGGAIGQGDEHMPAYQTIYVQVDSVDEHLSRAAAAGGEVVVPRTVIPGMISFGMFRDPAGNLIGLAEAETPAAE
jgi:predicted enzyme related to lactoylglutathione lyase